MKTTLFLMLLFVGLGSSAAEVRIDTPYLNDGAYDVGIDATGASNALYNENVDDPAVIQVLDLGRSPAHGMSQLEFPAFATLGLSAAIRTRVGQCLDHFSTSDRDGT
jgi:hypothetical protein